MISKCVNFHRGACGLAVCVLQEHLDKPLALAQGLLAVAGLAVKRKVDKVHNGNTRKVCMYINVCMLPRLIV